jgi:ABC-2 type transport system permease protein
MALYRRERKRYFASGIYVTNTILSPIMAVLLAVGLMVIGKDALVLPAPLSLDLVGAVPFLLGTVLSMMPIAAVSVSMEGKQFWVAQTLPLSTREILDAKLLWNFTLLAPGYLISEILLTIALRPTPVALLWQWLIPLCFTVLSVVFALRIDLSWCRFDWEKEQTVVKQSASAAIGGLVPTLVGLLLSLPAMLLPRVGGIVYRVCLLATFPLAIWGLYRSCVGRELHKLK